MGQNELYTENLDYVYAYGSPMGSKAKIIANNLRGIHIGSAGTPQIAPNLDRQGYVFFTRPQLNLSFRNCLRVRQMYNLLSKDPNSMQTYIRNTLDPKLHITEEDISRSTLVDHELPFIPILTNSIMSMSGWPDQVVPTFSSTEGMRKEVHTMVDGVMDYFQEFDIDVEFANIQDEPILQMFYIWEKYMTLVFEGVLNPYMEYIREKELDYNTRIYRIVTDKTDTYVSKMAATGASIPISLPNGKFADYQDNDIFSTSSKTLNIRFRCNGAIYHDDILMQEFNETIAIFNKSVASILDGGGNPATDSRFFKVPSEFRHLFTHMAFPYINLDNLELCWLVNKSNPGLKDKIDAMNAITSGE